MQIHIKSKRAIAITAVVVALLIALAGAFAWNSLNQQRINVFRELIVPGVTLHDDFDAPTKNVYVENSGEIRVLVRVRLTEFLQTAQRGSLVAGHERTGVNETDNARLNWSPHSGIPGVTECVSDEYHTRGENWSAADWFHEYYEWQMGGQKYYMPVKAQLTKDENGDYYDADGNLVDIDDYICNDTSDYDGTEDGVKQTLPADVITMQSWIDSGMKQGEFWVVDTDGWCYWAQMLEPETATGLLLNTVDRTGRAFDSSAEYCINVWLQAVDEVDVDLFRPTENGGISEDGIILTRVVTGTVLVADNGDMYENTRDSTFTQLSGENDFDTRAFIPLGTDGDVYAKINSEMSNRLYIGEKIDIVKLIWDGENFTNYDTENSKDEPWYNISVNVSGEYTLAGSEIGADRIVYLRLEDDMGGVQYVASVTRAGGGETAYSYSRDYPGTAPFGIIYQGNDKIGTNKDSFYPIGFERRYFYHIGTGVYVEVADKNIVVDAEPDSNGYVYAEGAIDYPETTYYFSNTISGDLLSIDNLNGNTVDENVADAFHENLKIGEFYGFYRSETSMCIIYKGDEMRYHQEVVKDLQRTFTMKPLYKHTDGRLYFEASYLLGDASQVYDENEREPAYSFNEYLTNDKKFFYIKGLGANGEFGGAFFGQRVGMNSGGEMEVPLLSAPSLGNGSQENPWKIVSRTEMEWITAMAATGETFDGMYFVVNNDFSMKDTDGKLADFAPIGDASRQFEGYFDGDGKTISDLSVSGSHNYRGLFGYIGKPGTVKNVKLSDVNVSGNMFAGAIVGANFGSVENCVLEGGTVTGNEYVGGIAGQNNGVIVDCHVSDSQIHAENIAAGGIAGVNSNGTIKDCTVDASVSGNWKGIYYNLSPGIGGIVGCNFSAASVVENCHMLGGTVEGVSYVGGIAGSNGATGSASYGGTITGCTNEAVVTGTDDYVGGISGHNDNTGRVYTSHNEGSVSGANYVGGVTGDSAGTVTGCTNSGVITGSSSNVGGIAGHAYGVVSGCTNTGTVTGQSNVGGVAGYAGYNGIVNIQNCANLESGTVIATGEKVGGIVGYLFGNGGTSMVTSSYNLAQVKGTTHVGGVAGYIQRGTVTNSYAQCDVTGTGNFVGGIVGQMYSDGALQSWVCFVYHSGRVNGVQYVGGIAGGAWGHTGHANNHVYIRYAVSYSTEIKGTSDVNKLAGNQSGRFTINNNYVLNETSLSGTTGGNAGDFEVGKTTTQNLSWWQNTVCNSVATEISEKYGTGFADSAIWRWDGDNKLPVSQGVTP